MIKELLSKTQIKRQLFWTNGCYRHAMLERYGHLLNNKEKKLNIEDLRHLLISKHKVGEFSPKVHDSYMKRVLAMDSEKLSLIVHAFQTGQQYRKQETIDAIMTELFERSANPETKEKA